MNSVTHSRSNAGWNLSDVVLAVRGADERPAQPERYLAARVEELTRLERRQAEGCLEMLVAAARDSAEDPEVLEALVLLGLAQPKSVARLGLAMVNYGRRAAALYERQEREDRARGLLALLSASCGENRAVERDLAALLRRSGELDQLVRRYVARAQERIDAGEPAEAIPWLQEVLVADPARKDIARMIRDLRFEESERRAARQRRRRLTIAALCLSLGVSLFVLREQRLAQAYARLGTPAEAVLVDLESHLANLEAFMADHPLWHGTLRVLEERGRLRVRIDALRSREAAERERTRLTLERRDEQADAAQLAATRAAELGQWEVSLAHFRAALELASESWPERGWAERNVEALERMLGETP